MTAPTLTTKLDRESPEARARHAHNHALAQELRAHVAEAALLPRLPQDLFPGGDKAGWWLKCVQLDLEAKGVIARAAGAPVRLHRV